VSSKYTGHLLEICLIGFVGTLKELSKTSYIYCGSFVCPSCQWSFVYW